MRYRILVVHVLFCLLLFSQQAHSEGSQLVMSAGRTVISLEVEGAAISPGELSALVPFSEGSELMPQLVREGVINFYETGQFDRVEVLLKDLPDGVAVKYLLFPKKWLEQIKFEGNHLLDDRELLGKVNLRSRDEITDDILILNVEKLTQYYDFRGFPDCEIKYRIEPDNGNKTKVVFLIREGKRKFISDVRLTGDPGISRIKLLSFIVSMPGSKQDGEDLDQDLEKIRKHLRKKMYLTPTLSYRVEADEDFKGGVLVVFNINKGAKFQLKVVMDNEDESRKLLKRMRSVFLKSATPEKAKLAMEKQVLDRYRNEGYPFTTVDIKDQGEGTGSRMITIFIDRGLKTIVGDVQVQGARFFSKKMIMDNLGIAPGEPYIKNQLEEGMQNVQTAYRKEGFLSTVLSRKPLNFAAREGYQEVIITLTVEEGPRNVIRSLEVESGSVDERLMRELLGFKPGDPYVPEVVNEGRDELLQELGDMGYLYAAVTVDEPRINSDDTVDLFVTIKGDQKVRLREVIISGNELVREKIIRTALDLDRGEILTRDKILKAQERIYKLKMMSSVDVQLADPQTPGQHKDLTVRVQERSQFVFRIKGGYGSEDKLRGEVSVTNRNFKKMARSLTLSSKASDIERGTTLLYEHPWFQSLPMDMRFSLSDLVEYKESYTRDSLSAAVDFVRGITERTEVRFGYYFEGLKLYDVSPDAQLSPDDEGKTDVAAVMGEILHDGRDDFLDPWSGVLGDIIVELAASALGSKTQYIKTEISGRRYINPVDDLVFAGLLRLGRVMSYGQSEEVIISKRFFLGGQNSVRGYRQDSLGPRDADGDPVGGNYMVNANLEMRYPIYKTLRGAIFLDSGSVWLQEAVDPQDEEFKMRFSAGAGIKWSSPIGPLSLDYGYKLNPAPDDEDDRGRLHLTIGHAF